MLIGNSKSRWGIVSILLHWVIACLFILQLALGITMVTEPDLIEKFKDYQTHKSIGFTILGLAVLRVLWVLVVGRPALKETASVSEMRLARASHLMLYGLLFALPLTGWLIVSATPLPIPIVWFGQFVIPRLPVGISQMLEHGATTAHAIIAYLAIGLVGVHSLAAVRHHVRNRDRTLLDMLWPGP